MRLVNYRREKSGILLGLAAALLAAWMWNAGVFRRLELISYDVMFRFSSDVSARESASDVVIVGITDECLKSLGPWPWPRSYHARLIDRLTQAGARVIAFDIIFSEEAKDDNLLADACRRSGRVIMPVCTSEDPAHGSGLPVKVNNLSVPTARLGSSAAGLAHINLTSDIEDGIARGVPLFIEYEGRTYPYFGAAIASAFSGRRLSLNDGAVILGEDRLPVDGRGQMDVNFNARQEGRHTGVRNFRYSQVLSGRVPAGELAGKAVIIGSIGPGLSDVHITPLRAMDGIKIHAAAIDTMLKARYIRRLPPWMVLLLMIFLGTLAGTGVRRYRVTAGLLFLLAMSSILVSSAIILFRSYDINIALVPMLLALLGGYVFALAGYFRIADRVIYSQDMRLSSLYRASSTTLSSFEGTDVMKMLLDAARTAVQADIYALALPGNGNSLLVWELIEGCEIETAAKAFSIDKGVTGEAFRACRPVMIGDIRRRRDFGCVELECMGRTVLSVPLVLRSSSVGVLTMVKYRCRLFTREDTDTVSALAGQAAVMLEDLNLQMQARKAYIGSIEALSAAIDAKDEYTHGHSMSVAENAVAIAERLNLSAREVEVLRHAALMHDVGKIGIRDDILLKPGALSDEEYEVMKGHVVRGMEIVKPLDFLGDAPQYLLYHHERIDGQGYPHGLEGGEIPLGARIICVADAFDAMTSDRLYRRALAVDEAIRRLREGAGTQFDADVVAVFLQIIEERRHVTPAAPPLKTEVS